MLFQDIWQSESFNIVLETILFILISISLSKTKTKSLQYVEIGFLLLIVLNLTHKLSYLTGHEYKTFDIIWLISYFVIIYGFLRSIKEKNKPIEFFEHNSIYGLINVVFVITATFIFIMFLFMVLLIYLGLSLTISNIFIESMPVLVVILCFILIFLANRMPQRLILEPIQYIIKVIEQNKTIDTSLGVSTYSEVQKIERQIQNLILMVEHNSRNAAIGAVAAEVAHDLRNPINGIRIILPKIIAKNGKSQELELLESYINQIYHFASDVVGECTEGELIIDNGLSEPEYIILADVIKYVVATNLCNYTNCEILVSNNSSSSWAYASPIKLVRIITNLLNNAYESLNHNNLQKIEIEITSSYTLTTIQIKDDGCGIPKDKLHQVIKGYSSKHTRKGIGLSSAIDYIQNIRGKLSITSKEHVGTTIIIELPMLAPNFYSDTVYYNNLSKFVLLDDNIEAIVLWQKQLRVLNNQKLYFSDLVVLIEHLKVSASKDLIIFINVKFYNRCLDIKEFFQHFRAVYILVNSIKEYSVQVIIKNLEHKILPVSLVGKVSFVEIK